MPTRTPVTVPEAVTTSCDYSFQRAVDRRLLRDTAPALWTDSERQGIVEDVLRTALHRNVADKPIHLLTVREHLDAVAAAKNHGQRYLNWWAGAQIAMDRVHQRVIAALGKIPDRQLAQELANDVGVLLADAKNPKEED